MIRKQKKMIKLTLLKWKTFKIWKTLLRGWKEKLKIERKYLKTTYLTKDHYVEYIFKNSQNSIVKNQKIQL